MNEPTKQPHSIGWYSRLPVQFKLSLILGGIVQLLAIAAGLRILASDITNQLAWRLPLGILIFYSTWFSFAYFFDRNTRRRFKPGRSSKLIIKSPFGTFIRETDESIALKQWIIANGVLLICGSVLVVAISLLALFGGASVNSALLDRNPGSPQAPHC